jgi:hypothetical protein
MAALLTTTIRGFESTSNPSAFSPRNGLHVIEEQSGAKFPHYAYSFFHGNLAFPGKLLSNQKQKGGLL